LHGHAETCSLSESNYAESWRLSAAIAAIGKVLLFSSLKRINQRQPFDIVIGRHQQDTTRGNNNGKKRQQQQQQQQQQWGKEA